jgi:polysaccharide export outer membrane protein
MLLAGLLIGFLAACGTGNVVASRDTAEVVAQTQTIPPYTLGSADRLRVTVFGHLDLSGEFEVDGEGNVAMPLIGTVPALGMTTSAFERLVAEKLSDGYILNPRVSAEVINYRPFYILGEVARPGEYPYTNGLSVQNAVAAAGGFSYRANRRVVFIKSVDSDREIAYDLNPTTRVRPGDTIRIGERIF